MKLAGKTVVVTGGGNGIGREVVLELLRHGAKVAAIDLREEALAATAELAGAGDRLATIALDITDREAVDALPARVAADLGPADGLVNVAGIIQPFVRIADLDHDTIRRVIDVNLYGTLYTVKAFLPGFLERPVAHVANVSSMGGFLPVPGQSVYGASKAAVRLLTEGLYAELLDTRVAVTLILPGAVRTDITGNSGVEAPGGAAAAEAAERSRFPSTSPAEAGRIIVDGIERDRLYVFVGKDARLMNVLTRIDPKRATQLITRQMRDLLG